MKIHSKFFTLIKNKREVLKEQMPMAPPPAAPVAPPAAAAPGTQTVTDTETIDIQEREPEFKELTPEGEVELIRLIRKALVLEPTEGTIPPKILDDEINENNGREMLARIKAFLNTYSDDPDINY